MYVYTQYMYIFAYSNDMLNNICISAAHGLPSLQQCLGAQVAVENLLQKIDGIEADDAADVSRAGAAKAAAVDVERLAVI